MLVFLEGNATQKPQKFPVPIKIKRKKGVESNTHSNDKNSKSFECNRMYEKKNVFGEIKKKSSRRHIENENMKKLVENEIDIYHRNVEMIKIN